MGTVSKKFGLSNTLPQIFYLVAAFVLIIASCVFLDNKLPEPLLASELKESGKTGAFSEELASEHLFYLAGEVGLRPTGTENEVKSYEYIIKTLEGFKANLTNPHVKQFGSTQWA